MSVEYCEVTEEMLKQVASAGKYAVGVEQVGNVMESTYYRITDYEHHYYIIGKRKERVHLNPPRKEVHYLLNRMYYVKEE